ncbi:MAG: LolA family protein [Halanaerobiales bacterium]
MNDKYEQRINDVIDKLNDDKKPGLTKEELNDKHLNDLVEVVRAVKRQKNVNPKKIVKPIKFHKKSNNYWIKGLVAACLMFFLLIGGLFITNPWNKEENIIHAMEEAYQELTSYEGRIYHYVEDNGDKEIEAEIDVTFVSPNRFKSDHHINGRIVTKIYDGSDKIYTINDEQQVIDTSSPEMEEIALEQYHMGEIIENIKENAKDVKKSGEDVIANREVYIYKYTAESVPVDYEIYLDKDLKLPLKIVIDSGDDFKRVSYFVDITINPSIDDSVFAYELDPDKTVVDNSDNSNDDNTDYNDYDEVLAYYFDSTQSISWVNAEFYDFDKLIYEDDAQDVLDTLKGNGSKIITIDMKWDEDKNPIVHRIDTIDEKTVTVEYVGLSDNSFGEFILDGHTVIFGIDESVLESLSIMKTGETIKASIEPKSWSGSPVVVEIID